MSILTKNGIYRIYNIVNGKFYIGSAAGHGGFSARWSRLRYNKYLKEDFARFKKENFKFEILLICEPSDCLYYEQKFLDKYKPWINNGGYNICKIAGSTRGIRPTPEQIAKRVAKVKGKKRGPRPDEVRQKISAAQTGILRGPHTEETRKKMSLAPRPSKSQSERAQISARQIGKKRGPLSDITKLKMSISRKNKPKSEIHRKKISEANKGKIFSDERKQKISESMKLAHKKRKMEWVLCQ